MCKLPRRLIKSPGELSEDTFNIRDLRLCSTSEIITRNLGFGLSRNCFQKKVWSFIPRTPRMRLSVILRKPHVRVAMMLWSSVRYALLQCQETFVREGAPGNKARLVGAHRFEIEVHLGVY